MALSLYPSTATTIATVLSSSSNNTHHHHHRHHHHHHHHSNDNNFGELQNIIDIYSLDNSTNCMNPSSPRSGLIPQTNLCSSIEINNKIPIDNNHCSGNSNTNSLIRNHSTLQQQQQQQQQSEVQHEQQQRNIIDRNNISNQTADQLTQYFNRNLTNTLHQHVTTDYGQIISYVDSPPNSEESWSEDHSKCSPKPQILNVQTIYSNSNANVNGSSNRKRRIHWNSLDVNDDNNLTTDTINHETYSVKEKYKRDKINNGRSTWSDDIGFDLNAEFNNNSYINNETFMPFSPGLTVLKQEPQTTTEQIKLQKNSPLNVIQQQQQSQQQQQESPIPITTSSITDKSSKSVIHENQHHHHHHLQGPQQHQHQQHQQQREHQCNATNTVNQDKINNALDHGQQANSGGNGISPQLLTVLNANKIDEDSIISKNQSSTSNDRSENGIYPNAFIGGDDYKFQYILAAATSIATKNNEETLTYLNQGQSYEIKLKKIGDLSFYRDKILKSVIKICFHERRLQFMEREQIQQWQASRPGERIIDVDVPLSYGLCHVNQPLSSNYLNTVEIFWDPMKEVGVYIKVNCISTEFTPKKHGGEKGVPFRLQIETYIENTNIEVNVNNTEDSEDGGLTNNGNVNCTGNNNSNAILLNNKNGRTIISKTSTSPTSKSRILLPGNQSPTHQMGNLVTTAAPQNILQSINFNPVNIGVTKQQQQPVHAAACQIKVFKLKGADRKHKQDREKIQKRPQSEQEKFQPSYECTIMNDIALDILTPINTGCFSPEGIKMWPNSPIHVPKCDTLSLHGVNAVTNGNSSTTNANSSSPIAFNNVTTTNSSNLKITDHNMSMLISPVITDIDEYINLNIMPESTPAQVTQWLTTHRLTAYLTTFAQFSGADIMRMSKDDLIQICGLADGIRMFNILRAKAITPRLTIYVSLDGSNYHAVYLLSNTAKELLQKLFKLPSFYELISKSYITINCTTGSSVNPCSKGCGNNEAIIDGNNTSNTLSNRIDNSNLVKSNIWPSNNIHFKCVENYTKNFYEMNGNSLLYVAGPSGIHVAITDEVLTNEIADGSLYGLEMQNGKVIMKLVNREDN